MILAIVVFLVNVFEYKREEKNGSTPADEQPRVLKKNDEHKAVLTLADGRIIILNQAEDGELAIQGANSIVKRNGILKYTHAIESIGMPTLYNKVVTPRGGCLHVDLIRWNESLAKCGIFYSVSYSIHWERTKSRYCR